MGDPTDGVVVDADAMLVQRLRDGDQQAFESLVGKHHAAMLAVARMYVRTAASAEDVVQDAWLGVLEGLGRFEGRSSLKTWIMRIVVNIAKTRGTRDARSLPFSWLSTDADDAPAVSPDRFRRAGEAFAGHWTSYPRDWRTLPEEVLLGSETTQVVLREIDRLPSAHRTVIWLRDVAGWSSEEVCAALELSAGNQRVLLHRARSRVRGALEEHLDG